MPDAPVKGLKQSPLRLNQGLGVLDHWNEDTIKARADKLSLLALDVWSIPTISADVMKAYKPETVASGYTIADHPQLLAGPLHDVFKALRQEILALDPCVTEEFVKLYVAYKAETNFVDVVPQTKRLKMYLNLEFSELSDPKGLCKDVSGSGHWGNGDVEIILSTLEELPYVMGLVRQAIETQLGSNNGG